ncbi:hypothetical protein GCM10009737_37780 [Nocardioides lentus]|uniref:Calcineurin-like phosphoesterase domain-containing protein n=1 Tax=Nocardioides lentus TaxID=338077 RepID=A0ABP5B5I9_9ACTN
MRPSLRLAVTTLAALLLAPVLAAAPAGAADDDPRFTIAVVPDTQTEVTRSGDTRFAGRTRWLVQRRTVDDLRFVLHTGDVTDWGWAAPGQLDTARSALGVLTSAGIPWQVAVGNHDTRYPGWDGRGGYGTRPYVDNPECRARYGTACTRGALLRRTDEIDRALPGTFAGRYDAGQIANVHRNFEAGGLRWMVLSLEAWPRPAVVDWARSVVAAHPRRNIIVNTHSYLTADGRISTSAEYGATSPAQLWERLLSRYPNVKLVFSGHTGTAAYRTDRGVAGNLVASFLGAFHSPDRDPVRLVTIDPVAGSVTSRFHLPSTGGRLSQYDATVTGLAFVRP